MQDRVPLYPGRVMLTPVPGQENTFDMVRADSPTQEGTPLNKANLLKDATAAMFGLGSDAVPDDVLVWIGNYNQHWWQRLDPVIHNYYSYSSSTVAESYSATITPTVSAPVSISSSHTQNKYGEMILVEPVTVWDGTTNPDSEAVRGKYVKLQNGTVWKVDSLANIISYTSGSSTLYQLRVFEGAIQYTPTITAQTDYQFNGTYVHSSDRNSFPDSGISGEYKYYYLGVPFDNAVNGAKIESGVYTGTGTYGSSNPCSLTFDFDVKLLIIPDSSNYLSPVVMVKGLGVARRANADSSSVPAISVTWNGNSVSWYASSAAAQLNSSGTYYYVAIG